MRRGEGVIMEYERRIRRTIPAPSAGHRCGPSCLAGEVAVSEQNLVHQGRIPPGPVMYAHIFVLGCRTIHVCTESTCSYWRENRGHTCPISGLEFGGAQTSSYSKNDSRTWYTRGTIEQALSVAPSSVAPVAQRPRPSLSAEQIGDGCTVMVKLLLYSRQRVERNNLLQQEQKQAADLACATYLQKQAQQRQAPFFTDLYRIRAYILFAEPPLCILDFDETRCNYYVAILTQIWQRVQRFYVRDHDKVLDAHSVEIVPRLDFESVILATLYGMRQGYRQRGVRIIPKDTFLAKHLPLINDLITHFKLPRDAITKGQKILRRAIDNAFLDNVPVDQIELDTGQLVNAVPELQEERIELDAGNRQVKITKSGERLFMLGSGKGKSKK